MNKGLKNIAAFLSVVMFIFSLSMPVIYAQNDMIDTTAFYVQADDVSPQGGAVRLNFSQELNKALALGDVRLFNTNGGTEITITEVECDGNSVTLSFKEELSALAEYMVLLPEKLESIDGNVIESPYVYFMTTENEPYETTTAYVDNDFSEERGFSNANPNLVGMTLTESEDGAHGQVLQIENKGTGTSGVNCAYPAFNIDTTADTIVSSIDFKVNEKTYYGRLNFQIHSSFRAYIAIKSDGKLALSPVNFVSNGNSGQFSDVYYKIGEWNNIKAIFDLKKKEITFEVNGKTYGPKACSNVTMQNTMQLQFYSDSLDVDTGNTIMFDNLKTEAVGMTQDPAGFKVSKVRFLNRDKTEAGPLSVGEVFGNATGARVYFSEEAEQESLDGAFTLKSEAESVAVSVGEYNSSDNSVMVYFDELLEKGKDYSFAVSGVQNTEDTAAEAYSTTFTVSDQGFVFLDKIGISDGVSEITEIKPSLEGAGISAELSIYNTLDTEAEVLVSAIVYNDFEMLAMDCGEYKIGADSSLLLSDESTDNISVVVDSISNLTLKLIVHQKTEKGYNLIGQTVLTNVSEEISESDRTFRYDGISNSGNNDITFEITEEGKSDIIFRDVLKSNDAGEYTVCFNMNEKYLSGRYRLFIYENGCESVSCPVTYINKEERAVAVAAINDGTESVADVLEDHAYSVIDDIIASDIDYKSTAEIISNYISGNGAFNTDDALNVINKAAYINAVSEGLLGNMFDYADKFDFANSSISKFYNKKYVGEDVQKYTTMRLKDCRAETFEEFDDSLTEAFVLAVVQKPDGVANLKEVLNAFYDEIGIKNNISDSVCRAIQNKEYDDFADLKAAIDKAAKGNSGSSNSGSSGGGGSGRVAGTKKADMADAVVNMENNDAVPILLNVFEDIDDDFWGKTAIVALARKDIINGKGDGKFYPDDNVTREEFVKIVVSALGYDTQINESDFDDVDKNEWYYPYISTAVNNEIITGYEDGRFGVGEYISRQDMCVILYRAAQKLGYTFVKDEGAEFTDVNEISDYAAESVNILSAEGIINGYDTGEFRPLNNSTRAECAALMYSFLDLFNKL